MPVRRWPSHANRAGHVPHPRQSSICLGTCLHSSISLYWTSRGLVQPLHSERYRKVASTFAMAQSSTQTCTETHQKTSRLELYELNGILPKKNGSNEQQSTDSKGVDVTPPPNAHVEVERWNWPKANAGRLVFACLSFAIAGMNDAAVGVRHPDREFASVC